MLSSIIVNSDEFGEEFWLKTFSELKYPIKVEQLDKKTLKSQGVLTSIDPVYVKRFYRDDSIEIVFLKFAETSNLTRARCTRVALLWKERRLMRPLLIFSNGKASFVVIAPGPINSRETRALNIEGRLYRTDIEVLESLRYPGDKDKLMEAYNTIFMPYEKVRDEFFNDYRSLFSEIIQALKPHLDANATSYAQRFLGRLMFLYFLQRKGWLMGDRRFIDTIKDYKDLNRVLYESLNKKDVEGMPFLNGSLFDKEDYMTPEMENKLSSKMNGIFKKARELFNKYNFTVDETAPLENDVSLDPALLGTVFENMLPEYERGEKGTYYTPREESGFICRRALSNYLGFVDSIDEKNNKFVDGLDNYIDTLSRRSSEAKTEEEKQKIEHEIRGLKEKLLNLKVLDPAVGSGGFLIAMMQEILNLLNRLDEIAGWRFDTEFYKKQIISNLYGFDMELEAIEIARLRLWLSLIIDEKVPEPLPNLDFNLLEVQDSLIPPFHQASIDENVNLLKLQYGKLKESYRHEHDPVKKKDLKNHLDKIRRQIISLTHSDPNTIESWMEEKADIVIMNPPYVRQEQIDKEKKKEYIKWYKIDKTSDLYAYFILRALQLVKEDGVVSLISSDKWLETGYGVTLQKKIKQNLIAVYGQTKRTFGADINSAITVLSNKPKNETILFVLLDSYSSKEVKQALVFKRTELRVGKWFFLKQGAKFLIEKILPKLTHRLSVFAEIKRGFTTGANEFFYMKDVSHLYGTDYLANPKKFEEWGVKPKTTKELKKQGLIYIENEGRERFVINEKDVRPLIRSPKQLRSYSVGKPQTLCLYTERPGEYTKKYIMWGEKKEVEVRGGGKKVVGYHNLETTKNRSPWYALPEFMPANILLPMFLMDTIYIPYSHDGVVADNTLYGLYYNSRNVMDAWLYLNSTVFYCVLELYSRRLGGGALEIKVEDYEDMLCPNLSNLHVDFDYNKLLNRAPKVYYEEKDEDTRRMLDAAMLRALGFDDAEQLAPALGDAWRELVEDRLVKADRPLKSKGSENDRDS